VFLWMSERPQVRQNELLIEQAFTLLIQLARLASKNRWARPDLLARVPTIESAAWLNEVEYRRAISEEVVAPLRNCPLVITIGGDYISPVDALLPIRCGSVPAIDVWK